MTDEFIILLLLLLSLLYIQTSVLINCLNYLFGECDG